MATKRLLPLHLPHTFRPSPRSTLPLFPHSYYSPLPLRPSPLHPTHRLQSTQPPKTYTFKDIQSLSTNPTRTHLLIDVREPAEQHATGRIPNSVSMPITSNPDAIYLPAADFHERFGFAKPDGEGGGEGEAAVSEGNPRPYAAGFGGADVGAAAEEKEDGGMQEEEEEGVKEVVFFCKAGVRSRAAMQMANGEGGWKGVRVGQWSGGWMEWEEKGGKVER